MRATRLLLGLTFVCCSVLGISGVLAGDLDSRLRDSKQTATAQLDALRTRVADGIHRVKLIGQSSARVYSGYSRSRRGDSPDVVLRNIIGGRGVGLNDAVRGHAVYHLLAHDIGFGQIVRPALLLPAGKVDIHGLRGPLMITEHYGRDFKRALDLAVPHIPEDLRIAIAVVDTITVQTDSRRKNTMVSPDGQIGRIDFDTMLGRYRWWTNDQTSPALRPVTAKRRPLAYQSEQRSLADLPPSIAELVEHLATAQADWLRARYNVSGTEAWLMQMAIGRIRDHGLDKAIDLDPAFE